MCGILEFKAKHPQNNPPHQMILVKIRMPAFSRKQIYGLSDVCSVSGEQAVETCSEVSCLEKVILGRGPPLDSSSPNYLILTHHIS